MDQKDEWKDYENFWVSPELADGKEYFKGWYYNTAGSKFDFKTFSWATCTANKDCNNDSCCAEYPDSVNKRCLKKTVAKTKVSIGKVSFTP